MPTPPYICNVCNAMLESLEQLLSHIETHHPQKIRLTCESCGKVFSAPEYLTQHKKLHTRADRFKCEICGKFFARKDYLTDHTTILKMLFQLNFPQEHIPKNGYHRYHHDYRPS